VNERTLICRQAKVVVHLLLVNSNYHSKPLEYHIPTMHTCTVYLNNCSCLVLKYTRKYLAH